jgi:hypothetical protein
MRGEVASLNKIVVSSLPSRDLAWTTYKWYSRSSRTKPHTLAQLNLAGWTCTPSIDNVVMIRCHNVECWLLCNEFEIVMIKDDVDTGLLFFNNVHSSNPLIQRSSIVVMLFVQQQKIKLNVTVKSAFPMPFLENTSKKQEKPFSESHLRLSFSCVVQSSFR